MNGTRSRSAATSGSPRGAPPMPPRDLLELWFATRRFEWRSLAVVSTVPGVSTFPLVQALGEAAELLHHGAVTVRCAEAVDLPEIALLAMEMSGRAPPPLPRLPRTAGAPTEPPGVEQLLIVATDPVVSSPLVLPVVLAADAVLLCVQPGVTNLDVARRCVDLIGPDRIIGAVVLNGA